jgi:NAD(P)-dependent dehydrogenase (short-subunit alcohol dehydrogenase family)
VFAVARRQDALDLAGVRHPEIQWLLADVSQPAEITAVVEAVVRAAGRLDVLINNAAVFRFGPLDESSDDMVRAQFEPNVYRLPSGGWHRRRRWLAGSSRWRIQR